MFSRLFLFVTLVGVVTSTATLARCFEPVTESNQHYLHRYQQEEVALVNSVATGTDVIKFWRHAPGCEYWKHIGCVRHCEPVGRSCNSLGSLLPILRSSCRGPGRVKYFSSSKRKILYKND